MRDGPLCQRNGSVFLDCAQFFPCLYDSDSTCLVCVFVRSFFIQCTISNTINQFVEFIARGRANSSGTKKNACFAIKNRNSAHFQMYLFTMRASARCAQRRFGTWPLNSHSKNLQQYVQQQQQQQIVYACVFADICSSLFISSCDRSI